MQLKNNNFMQFYFCHFTNEIRPIFKVIGNDVTAISTQMFNKQNILRRKACRKIGQTVYAYLWYALRTDNMAGHF